MWQFQLEILVYYGFPSSVGQINTLFFNFISDIFSEMARMKLKFSYFFISKSCFTSPFVCFKLLIPLGTTSVRNCLGSFSISDRMPFYTQPFLIKPSEKPIFSSQFIHPILFPSSYPFSSICLFFTLLVVQLVYRASPASPRMPSFVFLRSFFMLFIQVPRD